MNRTLGDSGCIERFERVVGLCFSADGQILYCVYKMPDTEKQVKACLWSTNHGTKVTERIIRDEEVCGDSVQLMSRNRMTGLTNH